MQALNVLKRLIRNSDSSAQIMAELREGSANESSVLNEKLNAVLLGIENQSELLNTRLKELLAQGGHHSPEALQSDAALELLRGIRDGISNETKVMQEKMAQLVEGMQYQSRLMNDKLSDLAQKIKER